MRNRLYPVFLVLVCLSINAAFAQGPSKTMPEVNHPILRGDEALPATPITPPHQNLTADIAGYTYQDCQTIGSTGNRVALGSDGRVFVAWTNLLSWPSPPGVRQIYGNWMEPYGEWYEPELGYQISYDNHSRFANLDIRNDNFAIISYHNDSTITVAREIVHPGWGIFDRYVAPNQLFPQTPENPGICLWPYICVDRTDRIHLVATESVENYRLMRLGYTRSIDCGSTWTLFQIVDTVMVVSSVLDASPVSDRVVLAYCKASDTTSQWRNDIVYYTSENGTTWDWQYGRTNVTDYENDSDSLWAYTDLDVIFDYNDYLHLIWNAQWVTDIGIYFRTCLFHFSEETEETNLIAVWPDSLWMDISGTWNRPICKMSMAARQEDNVIAAIWTQYDTSDVSAAGYGNGDIYMSYSQYGDFWTGPENITNTSTPGCYPGECASESWASLADGIDECLHIFCVDDKDAGSVFYGEGSATANPMLYLDEYLWVIDPLQGSLGGTITEVDSLTPIEGVYVRLAHIDEDCSTNADGQFYFILPCGYYRLTASKAGYHSVTMPVYASEWPTHYDIIMERIVGIDDEANVPYEFSLNQNCPNPFNQSTSISFSLAQAGPARLEIFDITGALVQTLVDENMPAGNHQITWDAGELASGTYFYRITSGNSMATAKAVLIK